MNFDHLEVVEAFIAAGADIKAANTRLTTPLHVAAGHGHMRLVRELLERGAALNARDRRGRTPAEMAMKEKRTKLVRFLVDRGAEVGIHLAAYLGDVDRVQQLLDSGVGVETKDADGKTALYWTLPGNQVAAARVLLANGADVNVKGNGNTLLLTALWHGYAEMAMLLAGAGARLDVRHSATGETPLEMAAYMGLADVVKVLLDQGADVNATTKTGRKRSAIYRGIWSGSSDVVALLIGHGADLEVRGIRSETPLNAAAGKRDPNIARLVIEQGVSLNEKDERGQTPLDWALDRENKAVVELLLAGGAEPTIHAAAYVGHIALTKRLLDSGTDVNQRDQENCTPLYYAALGGNADIVELLIAHGATVNIRKKGSDWKPTPLHAAAWGGETEVVRFLLAQGADIHAENPGGQEVLHVACRYGHADVAALLIAAGANVNSREEFVSAPLRLAGIYGHQDVVELLLSEGADVSQETMGEDITLAIQPQMNRQQVARHIIEACAPYSAIITSSENIRRSLTAWGIDVDEIWVPTRDEIRGLEPVLRSYLEKDTPRRRDDMLDRKEVLRQLHLYHREYAGYIDDETRYVICSMQLDDTHRRPFGDDFRRLFDGGMYVVTIIFDFDARTVAPMVYEWH
jgi:ankyrin repeat protein